MKKKTKTVEVSDDMQVNVDGKLILFGEDEIQGMYTIILPGISGEIELNLFF